MHKDDQRMPLNHKCKNDHTLHK